MMLLHHLLFPITYGVTLYLSDPPFGLYVMAVLQLCEFTTPFLHIRWFLSTLGMKSSKLYLYNGLVFTLSFIAVRGVLMTYMLVKVWADPALPGKLYWPGCVICSVIMACAWAFMALQYIWCIKVVQGSLSFLKTEKKSLKQG